MQRKFIAYLVILPAAFLLNVYYYRQYIIEAWMQFALRNEYIVVSLSTTPQRINQLEPTLRTLFAQNASIKAIYLNIPYVFKRENLTYIIPQWLLNEQRITILRCDDYGPATKLLGLLERSPPPDKAIIVTVDDDVYYPRNLVLQLAYKARQHPDRAIGIVGANPDYDEHKQIRADSELGLIKIKTADALTSVLQGYAGVAYRRNFFDQSIFEILSAPQDCFNSDDIYISFYLAKHKVPRQVLHNSFINACSINWETETGTSAAALHNLEVKPVEKHRSCIAYLQQHDPQVVF